MYIMYIMYIMYVYIVHIVYTRKVHRKFKYLISIVILESVLFLKLLINNFKKDNTFPFSEMSDFYVESKGISNRISIN